MILKFSEIFGAQEPVRKAKTDYHKRPVNKGIQQADYKRKKSEKIIMNPLAALHI